MSVTLTREGDIAHVVIDNPPVNATSAAVRQGLMDALRSVEADSNIHAVILSCAGRTFVAGADVTEFGKPPVEPHLPDVISAIEASPKPWIAAIHGHALGGGLELAMGCHARIADAGAKLGLPEVTLGLIPGAGGTVRLPRLVPAETALTMIATGKPLSARAALSAGLIDDISEGDLSDAAKTLAQNLPDRAATLARQPNPPESAETFAQTAKTLRKRAKSQLSPIAAIDAVERALTLPAQDALQAERDAFLALKSSDQSAALRRIFFAERQTLKDPRCKGPARPLTQIGVVGGGTMGAGIAAACLMRGLPVTLAEQSPDQANTAHERVQSLLEASAKRGLIPDLAATLAQFQTASSLAPLSKADLVIEAVFEDMDVKKAVFRQLDAVTRPDAILATNTSYLDVTEIAATLRDPSRAIGLHFFSPAHIMKLLEIVLPAKVADDVIATAATLSKTLGKTGVLAGVCDGFIGNRIMSAYRQEADYLIEDGASPSDVDTCHA